MQVNLCKFINHILFRKFISGGKDISQGIDVSKGNTSHNNIICKL